MGQFCRLAAVATILAAAGCATSDNGNDTAPSPAVGVQARADTPAATLRERIDSLLQERVALACDATGAALAGRNDEFIAAANALDSNSQEFAAAIGSIYGADAQNAILKLWRDQTEYLVDYTQGVLSGDQAKQTAAKVNLVSAADEIATYLETLTNGRLKKEVVAEMIKTHVSIMADIISAQQAKDYATAYNKQRDAEHQVLNIGDPLADAIVDQFPEKF
ncbi:MAG TPA: hypothetical protein VL992_02755 [Tepidisphaeraceae bacterium]|nr:hypothetical protein [Tepidisphaeraceae bacterium]